MAQKTTFLLCALLAVSYASFGQPRNIADQIKEELDSLQSIVQGQILAAHDDLANFVTDFRTNALNVANEGTILIQQEEEAINTQLTAIKTLAHAAGVDISSCTNIREQTLNRLPNIITEDLNTCISDTNAQASRIADDGRYIIDILINKVHDLQFQVRQCREDLLCLTPLLTEIELNKIRLPQNINTEVQAVDSLLTSLRLTVQTCSDTRVSQYATEAYAILSDIQACADRLIGHFRLFF